MDTFLTIVLAGVVGAFLGALAAFYLGELRDKQKQISARRIAEQRNLQKWRTEQQLRLKQWEEQEHQRLQERNQRLLDRRVEALDDIRIQALSFAFAFRSWADRAAHLKVQPIDDIEQAMGFSKGVAQLIDQGDEVSTKLTFLRGHYNAHSSILEQKSRHIIESFQRQSIERHSFLSNQLKATAASLQGFHLLSQAHQMEQMDGRSSNRDSKCWLGGWGDGRFDSRAGKHPFALKEPCDGHKHNEWTPEDHRQAVIQAANIAKDWDMHEHLRALDAEVGRIEGIRS